jgi:hypothetical protein
MEPLLEAITNGDSELVRQIITDGTNVNIKDHNGDTALMYTCQYDLLEMAKVLVDLGADVNIKDNNGNTALMLLCMSNQDEENDHFDDIVEFVQFLLKSGADINTQNLHGETVLDILDPDEEEIIAILKKWPTTMGLFINEKLGFPLDVGNLTDLAEFEGTRDPSGGKKRKSKKNNKKSKKNKKKTKKNKRKSNKRKK